MNKINIIGRVVLSSLSNLRRGFGQVIYYCRLQLENEKVEQDQTQIKPNPSLPCFLPSEFCLSVCLVYAYCTSLLAFEESTFEKTKKCLKVTGLHNL